MGRVVHKEIYVASIFGGVGDGKKEMLRKKTHVVRKKTHVVRKLFYVASIFGGVARRRNKPPWELSSTPWELSSTAGDFSSTASRLTFPDFTRHFLLALSETVDSLLRAILIQ